MAELRMIATAAGPDEGSLVLPGCWTPEQVAALLADTRLAVSWVTVQRLKGQPATVAVVSLPQAAEVAHGG